MKTKAIFWVLAVIVSMGVTDFLVKDVKALTGSGAKIDAINFGSELQIRALTFPQAVVNVVDDSKKLLVSAIDEGGGEIIFAFKLPLGYAGKIELFASDGFGLTKAVLIEQRFGEVSVLLPPTIYQDDEYLGLTSSLGFIGYAYPGSVLKLEIDGLAGENRSFETVADLSGEWQLLVDDLAPDKYQAKAKVEFSGMESEFSQIMEFEVFSEDERLVRDIGYRARQGIERVTGKLPEPAQQVVKRVDEQADFISKYIVPVLLTMGSLAQAGLALRNLLYLLMQALLALGQMLGLVKKGRQWGVIYDAITKKPLVRAIVRLYDMESKSLIETDVSNKGGVFSFLPNPGKYYLWASRPDYVFPSQIVTGHTDGEYGNVYTGGTIVLSGRRAVVNVSVPMDPVEYKETLNIVFKRWYSRYIEPINKYLLFIGAVLAVLSYTRTPNMTNFVVLWLYIIGLGIQAWQFLKMRRDWGVVLDTRGKPVAGVALTLNDVEYNRLVARRVTDEHGRYQFVAPPGRYLIRVVSVEHELMTQVDRGYHGEELVVEGKEDAEALVTPKLVVQVDNKEKREEGQK